MRPKFRIAISALVFIAMFAALICILYFAGFFWWIHPPPEPVYHGKPLSYWLSAYDYSAGDTNHPSSGEADEALRQIGTNAIPTLMQMLQSRDWTMKMKFYDWANRKQLFKRQWRYHYAGASGSQAVVGFQAIGVRSPDLMPQFLKIYESNPNGWCKQTVVASMGYAAVPDREAIGLLLRALNDTNDFILRHDAATAIGKIHAPPNVAVPALTRALSDPSDVVRASAARSLGAYGKDAWPAVEVMLKMMPAEQARSSKARYLTQRTGYEFWDERVGKAMLAKGWVGTEDVYSAIKAALNQIGADSARHNALETK